METKKGKETVLEFLEKFTPSSAEVIANGTGIFKLTVHRILKKLTESGEVETKIEDDVPVYSCSAKTDQTEQNQAKSKKARQEENGSEMEEPAALNSKGRNTDRLKFRGVEYPKGQTVLAVLRYHIEKNPRLTLERLKEQFPDSLHSRYGVVQILSKAKKMSQDRPRFFLKPDQILVVEKKRVAVCSQWGANNLKPFLKAAKSLNYLVK